MPRQLFLLSGQSNMQLLEPELMLRPRLAEAFPGDEIAIIKEAHGGLPISAWIEGPMLGRLIGRALKAIETAPPDTITFIWMQGERDARDGRGPTYAASLTRLIHDIRVTLQRMDMNVVIGRINEFGINNPAFPDWELVRAAQTEVAAQDPRAVLVNTDGISGSSGDGHFDEAGRRGLAVALASAAASMMAEQRRSAVKFHTP